MRKRGLLGDFHLAHLRDIRALYNFMVNHTPKDLLLYVSYVSTERTFLIYKFGSYMLSIIFDAIMDL